MRTITLAAAAALLLAGCKYDTPVTAAPPMAPPDTMQPPARRVVAVAVGSGSACAVTEEQHVWCWGDDHGGAFGNGTRDQASATPVVGAGGMSLTGLAMSRVPTTRACGLAADGTPFCWGVDTDSPPADGGPDAVLRPSPVPGGLHATSISVEGQTCALDASGQAWCWGDGDDGALGTGSTASATTPQRVVGGITFRGVTTGDRFTCGLSTAGQAWCWGDGRSLGDDVLQQSAVPVRVAGGHTFVQISAAGSHTCGLTQAGDVYCWGAMAWNESADPHPMKVLIGAKMASIASGLNSSCGIDTAGEAWCWLDYLDVYRIGGNLAGLAVGDRQTCAFTVGGLVWCWESASIFGSDATPPYRVPLP